MDNVAIARVLGEIADILEIKGENPFKIRAYRNAADIVSNHPHDFMRLDVNELREISGIGKDLATKIREIADTGASQYHQELLAEFPPTILDLMNLQGVGPKTVATLYRDLGVTSLDDLAAAAKSGKIRAIKGMGAKKEALILKALEERLQYAGRHLMSETQAVADAFIGYLQQAAPTADFVAVGSLRRGCETCGDIDIVATNADTSLMETFVEYPLVERVLGQGDTKSSVRLRDNYQVDLRLVASESRGAAMQYFTGSKAHNIALRDRAIQRGLKLNEYGLFSVATGERLTGTTEEEIYEALGLAWIPPELREDRGELAVAEARTLPRLIERRDLRGDLHSHTTETDGKDTIEAMARAAAARGLEYLAITDHSKALAMANGLDEARTLAHAERIRALDGKFGVRLLAGIECDILPDGSLDLSDECLAALDIVVASVHSSFQMERDEMTARVVRALSNPHVDILGHPTGRMLLRRSGYPLDVESVVTAAKMYGAAIEINSQAYRLDLSDVHARLARDRGVPIVISTDAHSTNALDVVQWGIRTARRAWLQTSDVMNTLPFDDFRSRLRRNQR